MKIAIIELLSSNSLQYDRHLNAYEVASWLKREGHCVSLSAWQTGRSLDELFAGLSEADRVLLWDESVYVDIAATKFALGDKKLSDALDEADVMTAACPKDQATLAVFSGGETFAAAREDLGSALVDTMIEKRTPVPCGAFGVFFVWIHTAALARILQAGGPTMIAGLDVSLSRRLIEGGASVQVDPRIAVVSRLTQTVPWSLQPA